MSLIVVPRVIGLCGKPGSGKDTVASILIEEFRYEFASFGEPIRYEMDRFLRGDEPIPAEIVKDPYLEELAVLLVECKGMNPWSKPTPKKLRVAMQMYATNFRRRQDRYYWANRLDLSGPAKAVPGTREPEQLRAIRNAGGVNWWIESLDRMGLEEYPDHESENMISADDCDCVLFNDKTIGDLTRQIIDALGHSGLALAA